MNDNCLVNAVIETSLHLMSSFVNESFTVSASANAIAPASPMLLSLCCFPMRYGHLCTVIHVDSPPKLSSKSPSFAFNALESAIAPDSPMLFPVEKFMIIRVLFFVSHSCCLLSRLRRASE